MQTILVPNKGLDFYFKLSKPGVCIMHDGIVIARNAYLICLWLLCYFSTHQCVFPGLFVLKHLWNISPVVHSQTLNTLLFRTTCALRIGLLNVTWIERTDHSLSVSLSLWVIQTLLFIQSLSETHSVLKCLHWCCSAKHNIMADQPAIGCHSPLTMYCGIQTGNMVTI